jgi:3D (Asp-Asp-Asp) domain-containing protein
MVMGVSVSAESKDIPSHKVHILADGGEFEYVTTATNVASLLKQAGVEVGENDEIYPQRSKPIRENMRVRVVRVTKELITQKEPINFKTVTRYDSSGKDGRKVSRKGENGEKEVVYAQISRDGVKSKTKAVSQKILKKPVNEVVVVTRATFLASRSGEYMHSIEMIATAYDPGPRSCGPRATGHTATGMHAGYGVAAVDPRFIRLGTKLYVEGYGFCVAADTGGAIKGNRIDLCYDSYSEAIRFGRKRVTVYILD